MPEQSGKVERSGLKEYFAAIEIVSEKNVPTYHSVISKVRTASRCHMDDRQQPEVRYQSGAGRGIECGVRSAWRTWMLEHEEVDSAEPPRQLLVVEKFLRVADALLSP